MAKSKKDISTRIRRSREARRRKRRKQLRKKVTAKELLELLPKPLLIRIGEKLGVDKQVKHLYGWLVILLLMYGIIKNKSQSLRTLEEVYNSQSFRAFSGKGGHRTRHSSIASRLTTIKVSYFEKVYAAFLENVEKKYSKKIRKEFGWLHRFDSTMVSLSAALTNLGMQVGAKAKKGDGKVQIKFTIGLQGILPTTVKFFHEQKHLSEETALYEVIESAKVDNNDIITFDMGLKDRKKFKSFSEKGKFFVTRLSKPRYEQVRVHKRVKGKKAGKLKLEKDIIVRLYSSGKKKPLQTEFRLIIGTCQWGEQAGKTFYFLTNIMHLNAVQISKIYLRRWDIEVFFRFLKQEIGLTSLLSYNENGIKAVLYIRLLTATILKLYMLLNDRDDYKISRIAFEEELAWVINITIAQSLNPSFSSLREIDYKLADFQGINST